jgi:hypothetical protein
MEILLPRRRGTLPDGRFFICLRFVSRFLGLWRSETPLAVTGNGFNGFATLCRF